MYPIKFRSYLVFLTFPMAYFKLEKKLR
jgi:hypothetical protein